MCLNNTEIIICSNFSEYQTNIGKYKKINQILRFLNCQQFENLNKEPGKGILAKWIFFFFLPCVFHWLSWPELTSYNLLCQT